MTKTDWDDYFGTCMYRSKTGWHQSELELYRKWYSSWLVYINRIVPIYQAVSIAKKLNPDVKFVVCDIEEGIQGNKKYDRILAFEVLEHLHNVPVAIANIKKHLNSKGYFIGTSPYPYPKNMLDPTHVNVQYPDYWLKMFRNSGFVDVSVRPISCLPFLWKIHPILHPILPFYIPFKYFVSTSLIIARHP